MSDDKSTGDRLADVAFDATEAVYDTVTGNLDEAKEEFLDMSRDAVDVITDGGFSSWVDRVNEEHDINLRDELESGLEQAGEVVAEGIEWVAETGSDVADTVGEAYDAASEWVGDLFE